MEKLYITGHKNPDTDSICSALAYQELKRRREGVDAEAIRLGDINRETKFVLEYFDVEEPRLKESMKPQVRDMDWDKAVSVSKDISLHKALSLIQRENVQSLPIIDWEEKLIGMVSLSDINNTYMEVWDDRILKRSNTPIGNILEVLSGSYIHLPEDPKELSGKMTVYAMDPEYVDDMIAEDDIVIIGNRPDAQRDALKKNVSMLIVTGGFSVGDDILEEAAEKNITIISTENPTFMAARLLPLSVPISYVMSENDLVYFSQDDFIEDAEGVMTKTRYRSYPVLDHSNKVVGTVSRYHLITNEKKKLVLVDHNEKNQSIDDIEEAEIVEIIDHHRVANVSTEGPVYFRNEPVGSTGTIISKMFFEQGIMPTRQTAGLLAAAIISDTLYFKSPTTTETDKMVLERISKIADIDPAEFAKKMFRKGTSLEGRSPRDLLEGDVKTFAIEGKRVRVTQIFTMDMENLEDIREDLLATMEEIRIRNGEDSFVVMLTDIFQEFSWVLVSGKFGRELAEAFDGSLSEGGFKVQGLLSRKKQLVPVLNRAVSDVVH